MILVPRRPSIWTPAAAITEWFSGGLRHHAATGGIKRKASRGSALRNTAGNSPCCCCVNGARCDGCPTVGGVRKTPSGATLVVSGVSNSAVCFGFSKAVGNVNGGPWRVTQVDAVGSHNDDLGIACIWKSPVFAQIDGFVSYDSSNCLPPSYVGAYNQWWFALKTDLLSAGPWATLQLISSTSSDMSGPTGTASFARQLNGACSSTITLTNVATNGTPGASGSGYYYNGSATITWDCVT